MIRGGDWYGGWGPPAATDAPPGWRVLTAADFGTMIEQVPGTNITLSDSGDPLYPLRIDYATTAVANGPVLWPIVGAAKAILDRQRAMNPIVKMKTTVGTNVFQNAGITLGEYDPAPVAPATENSTSRGVGMYGSKITSGNRFVVGTMTSIGTATQVLGGYIIGDTVGAIANAYLAYYGGNPSGGINQNLTVGATVLADENQDGTAIGQALSSISTTALATHEWCLTARRSGNTVVATLDFAIWIMTTPPPPPYIPQP